MKASDSLNLKPDKAKFVSEKDFKENISSQDHKTSHVMNLMWEFNLTNDRKSKIEFFFYGDTKEKAEQLATELEKLNYEVFIYKQGKRFSISGLTLKMNIEDEMINYWSKHMCQIGYEFDCEFDGWGMLVHLK